MYTFRCSQTLSTFHDPKLSLKTVVNCLHYIYAVKVPLSSGQTVYICKNVYTQSKINIKVCDITYIYL